MIPSKQHQNMPPRQIACQSTSLADLLQVQGSRATLAHSLVDYSTFRAPKKDTNLKDFACHHIQERSASTHEKRRNLLRERQRKSVLKQQQLSQDSVRVSMVDLVPPTASRSSPEDSDEESEVMFALKVSKPARLVPRPQNRRRRGSVQNWGNGSIAALSLLDESMTLVANTVHQEEEEEEETPPPSEPVAADFSQTCLPDHDSFQTSANFPAPAVLLCSKPDPRKQCKSMMNWLANRLPSKDLLEPPSKDPGPPLFVKVIYLPSDDQILGEETDEDMDKQNHKSPSGNTATKLEGMGSTHSRCSIVVNHHQPELENSHHRKVASSMA